MQRLSAFWFALVVASVAPLEARAQACCTSTGASFLAVAEKQHMALVSLEASYERGFGSFGADGRYRALEQADVDDFILALGGALRLGSSDWQVGVKAPLRLQHRKLRGMERALAAGPGDMRFDVRWSAIEDPAKPLRFDPSTWLFGITPFAGVLVPTGGSPDHTEEPTGVDIMGDGSVTLVAGVDLLKALGLSDAVDVEFSYGYRLARSVDATATGSAHTFRPGDEIQARLAYSHRFDLDWAVGVLALSRFTLAVEDEDGSVENSATRRMRGGLFVARFLSYPTWQLRFQALADVPVTDFGKNVPFSGPTFTLSLTRAFLR